MATVEESVELPPSYDDGGRADDGGAGASADMLPESSDTVTNLSLLQVGGTDRKRGSDVAISPFFFGRRGFFNSVPPPGMSPPRPDAHRFLCPRPHDVPRRPSARGARRRRTRSGWRTVSPS